MISASDIEIAYEAPPTLGRFLASDAFVRLIVGPVGSGKSSASVVEILRRAQEQEPGPDGLRRSRGAIIRNTFGQLRDTTRKTFEQWIPAALGVWRETAFTFELRYNDVRSEVLFRALDRPDHVRNLLSLELTWAYINEAKEIAKPVFDVLRTRLGRYPAKKDGGASWTGVWLDSNPPDTDHWLYRLFEEDRPDGFELFRQPGGLEPEAENLEHLDRCWDPAASLEEAGRRVARETQAQRLEAGQHETPCRCYYRRLLLGAAKDWSDVYVHGRYGFVKEGLPVFPGYNDALHCRAVEPDPAAPILLGMDFGLTPAVTLAQRRGASGQLQVFDELVSENLGAVNFAAALKRKLATEYPGRPVRGWGDPAGEGRSQVDERTPFDVVREAGLPVARAPTNDPRRRQEAVSGLLGRLTVTGDPAIVIDPKCRVLRKGFLGGYARKRIQVSGAERFRDEPDKNEFSHVQDALQYLCVGEGEDVRAISGTRARKVAVRVKVHRAAKGI